MTRTGLSPRLSSHIAEPFVEIHPDDAAPVGLVQGALARVDDAGTAPPSCACWSTAGSSRARCSCRSTGRRENSSVRAHRRAGAAGHRSPFGPARGQGDAGAHRPARRQPLRPGALAPAAEACRPRLLGGGAGHLRARAALRPRRAGPAAGPIGSAPCCPRATRSPSPTPPPAPIARPCCARGGSRPSSSSAPTPTLPAPEWLKSQFERAGDPRRRAPRSAGRPAGRGRRRRRRRSCASASRSAPRASRPRPAPAAARSRRSARASAPAPTAAAACPRSAA